MVLCGLDVCFRCFQQDNHEKNIQKCKPSLSFFFNFESKIIIFHIWCNVNWTFVSAVFNSTVLGKNASHHGLRLLLTAS